MASDLGEGRVWGVSREIVNLCGVRQCEPRCAAAAEGEAPPEPGRPRVASRAGSCDPRPAQALREGSSSRIISISPSRGIDLCSAGQPLGGFLRLRRACESLGDL